MDLPALKAAFDRSRVLALAEREQLGVRGHRMQCPHRCHDDPTGCAVGDNGLWHCKRCDASGSVVDLLMATRQIELRDAIRVTEELLGVLPEPRPKRPELEPPDAGGLWDGLATDDAEGAAYLAGRGLGDAATFGRVRFATEQCRDRWLARKASEGYRVAVPMRDADGIVRNFQLRATNASADPLKLSLPQLSTKTAVFGDPLSVRENEVVFCCEGMADTLALGLAGVCAIGAAGTSVLRCLADFIPRGKIVVLCPQNDPRRAAKANGHTPRTSRQAFEDLATALAGARIRWLATPPPHKDPAEWFQRDRTGLAAAIQVVLAAPDAAPPGEPPPPEKPRVSPGLDIHRILEELDAALAAHDPRIFQRDGEVVMVRGVTPDDARRMRVTLPEDSLMIAPVQPAGLLARISEFVDYGYMKATAHGEVWRPDLPTARVLAAFLQKPYWLGLRRLRGITETPILHLDDGDLVHQGYDPQTQYFVASKLRVEIPDHPTADDARAALASLREPFEEFPYDCTAARYTGPALALTLLLRAVIPGNVPGFVSTAPQKNCGKSLEKKAACALATGHVPAANTWPKLDEEQEKMLGAAADAGATVVFFDNVAEGAVVGGAPLDKVLTCDGRNSFRVLGRSTLKNLPWNAVVVFTANRAKIGGDSDRRLLVSTLVRPDAPVEHHRHEPLVEYVLQHRADLVGAALTLARAWVQAGKPRGPIRRLDSFEQWGWTVPAMIQWAGGEDVRELVRDVVGTDTDEAEYALLRAIHRYLVATGRTSAPVADMLRDADAPPMGLPAEIAESLRDAMDEVAGHLDGAGKRSINRRKLGKRLSSMQNVLRSPYRLLSAPGRAGVAFWTVTSQESLTVGDGNTNHVVGLGGLGGFYPVPSKNTGTMFQDTDAHVNVGVGARADDTRIHDHLRDESGETHLNHQTHQLDREPGEDG